MPKDRCLNYMYDISFGEKGGSKFQVTDLQDGSKATLSIPIKPAVEFFDEIKEGVARKTLYVPKSSTFSCMDMLIAPGRMLHVTVSKRHPIKSESFKVLLNDLVEKEWVKASKDAKLIFVVPRGISADFKKQEYENAKKVLNDDEVPVLIKDVKQSVLWIDLEKASKGGSPGLSGKAYLGRVLQPDLLQ